MIIFNFTDFPIFGINFFYSINDIIDNIFLIHKDKMSDYSNSAIASEHTFYYDIILYELYPKKIKTIEYQEFIQIYEFNNQFKENNNFFIFFDLSVDQIKKVNFIKNSFFINTY